jgi:hypothetical protein
VEHGNTLRDLLGNEPAVAAGLPNDEVEVLLRVYDLEQDNQLSYPRRRCGCWSRPCSSGQNVDSPSRLVGWSAGRLVGWSAGRLPEWRRDHDVESSALTMLGQLGLRPMENLGG